MADLPRPWMDMDRLFGRNEGMLKMALFWLVIPVVLLVALDLAALRFGADSRPKDRVRANWW